MYRKMILAILALVSPLFLSVPASAQSALLFGQKHYYSVTFRANQEAIVYARIVLTNNTDMPLTNATFTNGNQKISELVGLQMILPKVCDKYSSVYPATINTPACDKYSDPDYTTTYSYNPDGEQTQYYNLSITKKDTDFNVTFSKPIDPTKSGAIVLAYVSKDYVKSGAFDVKNYDFKTLGAEARQSTTSVAIDVDGGLSLKGALESQRGGYPLAGGVSIMSADTASSGKAITNKTLDTTVAEIGNGGKKIETATGVAPGEQFSAKGSYATSSWRLYAKFTLVVTLIIVGSLFLVILLLVMLVRHWLHSNKKKV